MESLIVDARLPLDQRLVRLADGRQELEDGGERVVEGRVHLECISM